MYGIYAPVDLHPSKTLFSLDTDNLQLHSFLGLGAFGSVVRSFCPLDQPCKTLQIMQVALYARACWEGEQMISKRAKIRF